MRRIDSLTNLDEALIEVAIIREEAAMLQRLRGVLFQRFRQHTNAKYIMEHLNTMAEKRYAEFERKVIAILDAAVTYVPVEGENSDD